MRGLLWQLTLLASRLLDPADQEPVLGDLEERQLNGTVCGLGDVLSLVGLRQVRMWTRPRPWIALFLLFPSLDMVAGCATSIIDITSKYPWRELDPLTPAQAMSTLLAASSLTAIWSWTLGFGLGWLARRSYPGVLLLLTLAGVLLNNGGFVVSGPAYVKLLAAMTAGILIAGPLIAGLRYRLARRAPSGRLLLGLVLTSMTALFWIGFQHASPSAGSVDLAVGLVFLWPLLLPVVAPALRFR